MQRIRIIRIFNCKTTGVILKKGDGMHHIQFEEFFLSAQQNQREILILTHDDPDGDAVGSALGLKHIFRAMDKKVSVIFNGLNFPDYILDPEDPDIFLFESGTEGKIFAREFKTGKTCSFDYPYLCLILTDSSNISRTGIKCLENVSVFAGFDHHADNSVSARYNYCLPQFCSASEIILKMMDDIVIWDEELYKKLASNRVFLNYLLLGLLYDTYYFQTPNTDEQTFIHASRLIGLGAEIHKIRDRVFKNSDPGIYSVWGKILENIIPLREGRIILAFLPAAWLPDGENTAIYSRGFINHLMSLRDAEGIVFLTEKEKVIKGSARSVSDFAHAFCSEFGGGGHPGASGFTVPKDNWPDFSRFVDYARDKLESFPL